MMQQRRGRIINISSVAAEHVNLGQTNYAASKGAINAFTRALAVELASRGVTVNAIAPGFIETDMSEAVRNKAGDIIKKMIPMRRIGTPEDIARVAVFLASADSGYITGQVLTVDGGLSLGAPWDPTDEAESAIGRGRRDRAARFVTWRLLVISYCEEVCCRCRPRTKSTRRCPRPWSRP